MADPLTWTIIGSVAGMGMGIASYGEQKAAVAATKEEKIRTYQYNIQRIKEETAGRVGDITREGKMYERGQRAAIGFSGAEIAGGTPLMAMVQTAASIERDITRTKRAAQLETEYYQEMIDILGGGKHDEPTPQPKKKTGGYTSQNSPYTGGSTTGSNR